uniref:DUF4939 domain-containing protein n=1 Tax=Nothobranchius furzeri TaxID=105023 RepID=A0A8C6LGR4_NOTFU
KDFRICLSETFLPFRLASAPDTFSGESGKIRCFLLQCMLTFDRTPETFISDPAKISYIVGLLRGRALQWAEAKSREPGFLRGTLDNFLVDFNRTFGRTETLRYSQDHLEPEARQTNSFRLFS